MKYSIPSLEKGSFEFYGQNIHMLRLCSNDMPDKPGIYMIYTIKDGMSELVYFGKAGGTFKNGRSIKQNLAGRFNNVVRIAGKDISREMYLTNQISHNKIDKLKIEWFVTLENPLFVERDLYLQFENNLPSWNVKLGRRKGY